MCPALYKSPFVVENSYSGAFLIILLGFVEDPNPPEYFGKHLRRFYHNRSVAFLCELNLQSHPALAEQVAPASWFPNRTCGFPSHPALRFIPYSVKWQKIFIRAGQAPVIRTSEFSSSVMLLKNQASIYIFSVG